MQRSYKYLDIITVIFAIVLLLSNIIASQKLTQILIPLPFSETLTTWGMPLIGGALVLSFTSGLFFFPLSYLAGDILTEVYGYSRSRRVIWIGFLSLILANLIIKIIIAAPPAPSWTLQPAYEQVFESSLRISACSMLAYFCGEFTNSYTLAKLKIYTDGKLMPLRLIGSTVAGELVDTLIFYPLAFTGLPGFTPDLIFKIMVANYIFKVLWEVIAYPGTRVLISYLKKQEHEDYYDYKTDFNPFHVSS